MQYLIIEYNIQIQTKSRQMIPITLLVFEVNGNCNETYHFILPCVKIIELHAPTSSTQKLKLIGKGGQFIYTPTLPLTCRLPQAAYVEYWSGL
jgi:hypothetical protein